MTWSIRETLRRIERSVQWWLGNWWRYSERRFKDGSLQAIKDMVQDATGHIYSLVTGAAWVASKLGVCRRRQTLPFSHHAEVASLPAGEPEALLDEAERAGSGAQLRDRRRGGPRAGGPERTRPVDILDPSVWWTRTRAALGIPPSPEELADPADQAADQAAPDEQDAETAAPQAEKGASDDEQHEQQR